MLGTKCSERNRQAYLLLHGINPLVDLSESTPPGIEVKVVPATIPWDKIRRGRCGMDWNKSGYTNSTWH